MQEVQAPRMEFAELDSLSLHALLNAVFHPAGFSLIVLYLDRSPGSVATQHDYPCEQANNSVADMTIRFLYRPYVLVLSDEA